MQFSGSGTGLNNILVKFIGSEVPRYLFKYARYTNL